MGSEDQGRPGRVLGVPCPAALGELRGCGSASCGAGVARAAGPEELGAGPTAVPPPTAGNSSLIRAPLSPGRGGWNRVMGSDRIRVRAVQRGIVECGGGCAAVSAFSPKCECGLL